MSLSTGSTNSARIDHGILGGSQSFGKITVVVLVRIDVLSGQFGKAFWTRTSSTVVRGCFNALGTPFALRTRLERSAGDSEVITNSGLSSAPRWKYVIVTFDDSLGSNNQVCFTGVPGEVLVPPQRVASLSLLSNDDGSGSEDSAQSSPFVVGNRSASPTVAFADAHYGGVGLWKRVLTLRELQEQVTLGLHPTRDSLVISRYQGQGLQEDLSGHRNHGTPINMEPGQSFPWSKFPVQRPRIYLSGAGVGIDQEGFRWRNDDGTEITATWRQAQDVNDSVNKANRIRLRVLLDADNDPDSESFQVEYRESGDPDSEYRKVEVV